MPDQLTLFDDAPAMPPGFEYEAALVSREHEIEILGHVRALPFREFEFQGYVGKRRVVSFGWRYDFNDRSLHEAKEMPPFLLPLRDAAARFAQLLPATLQHVLVTKYAAGAGIGWHRDKGVFDDVIDNSLLSPCALRMRRRVGERWERRSLRVEPRSVYLFRGEARTDWEHSIPEVEALRYSITFRNLRASVVASAASSR